MYVYFRSRWNRLRVARPLPGCASVGRAGADALLVFAAVLSAYQHAGTGMIGSALALIWRRRVCQLQRLADEDTLTRLNNRRAFE